MKTLLKILPVPTFCVMGFILLGFWGTVLGATCTMLIQAAIMDHGFFKRQKSLEE